MSMQTNNTQQNNTAAESRPRLIWGGSPVAAQPRLIWGGSPSSRARLIWGG